MLKAAPFARALLAWYDANHRPLPWRTQPSLYRTVVSEFMCQQTQVATVLPYFERWMATLPDFEALAAAEESRVLKLWEGLGYYSRARNLHQLARQWVSASEKPGTAAAWRTYPGVGPYTAAAIASIAHGECVAVVDGNVVRVLARVLNETHTFPDNARATKHFAPEAEALIASAPRPGDHNQALMELGATLCTKAKPQCLLCPVKAHCAGLAYGDPTALPRLAKRKTITRQVDRALALDGHRLLLHRIPANATRLAGLCELPELAHLGREPGAAQPLLTRKRGIANERIEERFFVVEPPPTDRPPPDCFWQALTALEAITLTGPHRKWLPALLERIAGRQP